MKGIDIFCSSPASTAICVSIQDQRSIGRHGAGGCGGGSRAIDRYNPHLIDRSRRIRTAPDQLITATTTTTSSTSVTNSSHKPPPPHTKPRHNHDQHHHQHQNIKRNKKKKTSTSSSSSSSPPAANKPITYDNDDQFLTPGASSRYLLGDTAYLDVISELEPQVDHFSSSSSSSALVHLDSATTSRSITNTAEYPPVVLKDVASSSSSTITTTPTSPPPDSATSSNRSSSSSNSNSSRCLDQVVELKVSLHCRGCERKMKKHISRMQGVRTFSIDFATKKVTVIGDVSPLSVLDSISRVKNAQFWSSSAKPSGGLVSCR